MKIRRLHAELDPFDLKNKIEKKLKIIFQHVNRNDNARKAI